jgi:hypothetical protein
MGYGPKREKGPTRNGDNGLKFNTLRKSPVVLGIYSIYHELTRKIERSQHVIDWTWTL